MGGAAVRVQVCACVCVAPLASRAVAGRGICCAPCVEKRTKATRHVPRDAGKLVGLTRYTAFEAGEGGGGEGSGGGGYCILNGGGGDGEGGGGRGGPHGHCEFEGQTSVEEVTPNQRHDWLRERAPEPVLQAEMKLEILPHPGTATARVCAQPPKLSNRVSEFPAARTDNRWNGH